MAVNHSTEPPGKAEGEERQAGERAVALLRRLDHDERLAAAGAAAVLASLLLPWYAPAVGVEVVKTGFSDFGFAHLALVSTVLAALVLIWRVSGGYRLPRPLEEGMLLAAAGTWAALIVVYLMLDRPEFEFLGFSGVRLRYGIVLALAGSLAIAFAGLRKRRARPETGPGVGAGRGGGAEPR